MKNYLSILCFILVCLPIQSQESKKVISKIDQVVVYFNGAQISRSGSTSINPGMSQIVFSDLPQDINPQSIQLTGKGGMTLLSVSHQMNYLNEQKKNEEVAQLQKTRQELSDKHTLENNMFEVYSAEEEMLKKNQEIKGSQTGISVVELKSAVDYFRLRMTDIRMKKIEQQKKLKNIQEEITKLDAQINQVYSSSSRPTSEVLAIVKSEVAVNASFTLSYYIPNAGWTPNYDIRVESINKPVNLTYKANVYQNSGEDWKRAKLWLSTANPALGGTKPVLYPWYLDFYRNVGIRKAYDRSKSAAPAAEEKMAVAGYASVSEDAVLETVSMNSVKTDIQINSTSFMYKIAEPYDISGDGKQFTVVVNQIDIPATYEYYCAPKIDKDAFLLAHVTGWQEFNLLAGEANLFFEGTYVGKSFLDVQSTKDTLDFSLGRDKGIIVERTLQKGLSERTMLTAKRKINKAWDINIRNSKSTAIDIVIEDQFPVSSNAQIKIDQGDYKNASLNSVTGILSWKLKIESGKSEKLSFSYSVEYPKEQTVIVE